MRSTCRLRVSAQINRMRRILCTNTQRTRCMIIPKLETVFEIASSYARAEIAKVVVEDGKERPLTIVERQQWARIAAYSVEILNNVAKDFDERKIDQNLDRLEAMLNKIATAVKTQSVGTLGSQESRKAPECFSNKQASV